MQPLVRAAMALALLGAATGAQAHAKLVSSDPAANGSAGAPSSINLNFSEAISDKLSGAEVTDAKGAAPATAGNMTSKDNKSLMVMFQRPLAPGAYKVSWHAVASDDGHRTTGTYAFTVK